MLEVQELTKKYGKNVAVDHVSFMVQDGQVGILLGPNGAGKSTIIKSIAGLLRYEGGVGINGRQEAWKRRKYLAMYRRFRQCLKH